MQGAHRLIGHSKPRLGRECRMTCMALEAAVTFHRGELTGEPWVVMLWSGSILLNSCLCSAHLQMHARPFFSSDANLAQADLQHKSVWLHEPVGQA